MFILECLKSKKTGGEPLSPGQRSIFLRLTVKKCHPVSEGIHFEWKGEHSLNYKYEYGAPYDVHTGSG